MFVDRCYYAFHRHAKAFCGRLDNAHIGLVRNKPVDIFNPAIQVGDGLARDLVEGCNSALENGVALHLDKGVSGTGDIVANRHTVGDMQ